eukprot:CAMPEP_0119107816 /NCGR_PEP_ID=MMETSP1180-20130426/11683_1 /TAXON_ID=3052 ORGANISM="Chlamydomonas cf sp, Strain CCMP681" /NCGR_SAMPLE_ID=MMETSP1180 /ASSEMBLY_ACC=CAM_ASM_000741 /LENGTH=174 /DNA_ID=CAMNT_0007093361 /DNA_START=460 /DNA_END=985 /DNA_ORIENTATION=-
MGLVNQGARARDDRCQLQEKPVAGRLASDSELCVEGCARLLTVKDPHAHSVGCAHLGVQLTTNSCILSLSKSASLSLSFLPSQSVKKNVSTARPSLLASRVACITRISMPFNTQLTIRSRPGKSTTSTVSLVCRSEQVLSTPTKPVKHSGGSSPAGCAYGSGADFDSGSDAELG